MSAAVHMEPLVRVEDIHTYYGKSHILHGVSLEVRRGEIVGLLGRNGVGKSTTLKAIMGLVHPARGEVLLEGQSVGHLPAHRVARLGIGYVPEDRRIFRLLTVSENLRTGLDGLRCETNNLTIAPDRIAGLDSAECYLVRTGDVVTRDGAADFGQNRARRNGSTCDRDVVVRMQLDNQ